MSPFIDPVTKKKVLFVDRSANEAQLLQEWFDLAHLETCMSGTHPGQLFELGQYRYRMEQEDAQVLQLIGKLTSSNVNLSTGSSRSDLSTAAMAVAS